MKLLIRIAGSLVIALLISRVADAQPRYEDIYGNRLPAQKTVRVFGQRIAFYDMGQASASSPVLVLVHGYGSQADVDFGAALPALSRSRRVIALDEIGFGNSGKPLIEYRVQTFVDFLGEFLRTLHIAHFDLAGESLGGWIAASYTEQALAAENTGPYALPKPRRLILEDAAGFSLPDPVDEKKPYIRPKLMVSTVAEVVTGLRAVFYDPALVTEAIARRRFASKLQANDGITTSTFSTNPAVRKETAGERAGQITVPTLVIWGAEDKTVPLSAGEGYAKAIPGASLQLIERSGHVPSLEQPQRFVEAVDQFLRR